MCGDSGRSGVGRTQEMPAIDCTVSSGLWNVIAGFNCTCLGISGNFKIVLQLREWLLHIISVPVDMNRV